LPKNQNKLVKPKYTKAFDWILNDRYRLVQHLFFWLFFYADVPATLFLDPPELGGLHVPQLITFLLDIFVVYFNLYFLIPKLLLKNKARLYLALTFLTVLLSGILNNYVAAQYFYTEFEGEIYISIPSEVVNNFIFQASVLGTAIGINILKRFLRDRYKIEELENANLKTELAYLKEQINPHFLFNALNNIYVQTRKRPKEASESILLLSDLLRYQLYDCAKEKVYLKGELEYLKNYLKLDSFRKNNAEIKFEINGNPNGKMVAPFIFIPFIENAVKHGLSIDNESFIRIQFDISKDKIIMTVENSKPQTSTPNRVGGIGLNNVKRRLDLLYPDTHDLTIEETKSTYKTQLILRE
jgi:sensor histidine kinase YesM